VVAEERAGATRYRLLETLREYGAARLAEAGEADALQARHYDWYTAWAEAGEQHFWGGPEQLAWATALETEWMNLRQALRWSVAVYDDRQGTLRLVAALWRWWDMAGHYLEGQAWCEAALGRSSEPTRARGLVLMLLGFLRTLQDDVAGALAPLEEALALGRTLEDPLCQGLALHQLGVQARVAGDFPAAAEWYAHAEALGSNAGVPAVVQLALHLRGEMALRAQHDAGLACDYLERAVALARATDERWVASMSLSLLGFARVMQGEVAGATRALHEALDLDSAAPPSQARWAITACLALAASAAGDWERAARLCGIEDTLRERLGLQGSLFGEESQRVMADARAALGEAACDAARAAGRALSPDEATAYLRLEPASPTRRSGLGMGAPGGLTPREYEVAVLVARGQSNREIAAALVIGERTVETHVTRVLQKLNLQRRAQVAAWAAAHDLLPTSHQPLPC
jgi:non-specific serine/threonine protein kinase